MDSSVKQRLSSAVSKSKRAPAQPKVAAAVAASIAYDFSDSSSSAVDGTVATIPSTQTHAHSQPLTIVSLPIDPLTPTELPKANEPVQSVEKPKSRSTRTKKESSETSV